MFNMGACVTNASTLKSFIMKLKANPDTIAKLIALAIISIAIVFLVAIISNPSKFNHF